MNVMEILSLIHLTANAPLAIIFLMVLLVKNVWKIVFLVLHLQIAQIVKILMSLMEPPVSHAPLTVFDAPVPPTVTHAKMGTLFKVMLVLEMYKESTQPLKSEEQKSSVQLVARDAQMLQHAQAVSMAITLQKRVLV